jgi:broad specificity phosphatase PhoE
LYLAVTVACGNSVTYDSVCRLTGTSPLKRTLQSTRLAWGPAIERLGGLKNVICLPQAQECADWTCDVGSAREALEADPEFAVFDFSLLTPDWTSKRGFYAPDPVATAKRAAWVRRWLRDRPEHSIVIVAHGDIIRELTGSAQGPSELMWANAEARIYNFDPAMVASDDCFFLQQYIVAAAGEHGPSSTEIERLAKRREAFSRPLDGTTPGGHGD